MKELVPAVTASKHDADYVFYELTRSICPDCRRAIDAQIVLREDKVYMRKRCPEQAPSRRWSTATPAYTAGGSTSRAPSRFAFTTEMSRAVRTTAACAPTTSSTPASASSRSTAPATWTVRCASPTPAGLQPDAGGGRGDPGRLRATEGYPGGRAVLRRRADDPPTDHRLRMRRRRAHSLVMINTNGKRIATTTRSWRSWPRSGRRSTSSSTASTPRPTGSYAASPILDEKLRALDRLARSACRRRPGAGDRARRQRARGRRDRRFRVDHPAVCGINFQPAFHAGRHRSTTRMQRMTIPDMLA